MRKILENRAAVVCLVFLSAWIFLALAAPFLPLHPPDHIFTGQQLKPPAWNEGGSWQFPFGTDDLGRDLLSRLVYGSRISLGFGFLCVVVSVLVGGSLGLTAGFFGGWWDRSVLRAMDILMALPSLLLAIVVVAVLGPSLWNALWAVTLVALPGFVRITRASVLAEREKEYVQASRAFGAGRARQMLLTILPNCMAPMIVQASLGFSDGILNMAALGFLGLGAQPPTAEWGVMLADSKAFMESAGWLVTWPGLCILSVVLSFNLLGDGLRDAFDPKL
ncbi:MAG: ABC transporter permease subunit [Bdellovibrionales bacterium]|nr:ABC transporter permease subunit [Bdellovibrionales bacterium]